MLIACIISFIIGAMIMFIYISISASIKEYKSNNVHFYVARDEDKELWLYLGKPIRKYRYFICNDHGRSISHSCEFKEFGLNKDDYKNLKWKDKPVEVFLNLED